MNNTLAEQLGALVARVGELEVENTALKAKLLEVEDLLAAYGTFAQAMERLRAKRTPARVAGPRRRVPVYQAGDMQKWRESLVGGRSLKDVAREYNVDPATIKSRLAGSVEFYRENGMMFGRPAVTG